MYWKVLFIIGLGLVLNLFLDCFAKTVFEIPCVWFCGHVFIGYSNHHGKVFGERGLGFYLVS